MADVIDCWVNPFTPEVAAAQRPEFLVRVATDYFHRAEAVFRGTSLDEMVALMEQQDIAHGLLTIDASDPAPMAQAAARCGARSRRCSTRAAAWTRCAQSIPRAGADHGARRRGEARRSACCSSTPTST